MDLILRAFAVVVALAAPALAEPPAPVIRLEVDETSPNFATIEVHGLDEATLARLHRVVLATHDWPSALAVYTGSELPADAGRPPVAGRWEVTAGVLRFRPRYPLRPGLAYVARFDLAPLAQIGDRDLPPPVVATFSLPVEDREPTTVVSAVYPTASELPENLLKLYLHFSAPMSRGEAYERIRLQHGDGGVALGSFLEIGEELWDTGQRRLTLFFDPGRIKRGLRPHLEAGPPLSRGKRFRLVIDSGWLDASGLPLASGYEKTFTVVAADRESPDPAAWQLAAPEAGARAAVELRFPEPLDHALLRRVLRVRDPAGAHLAGRVEVGDAERLWRFTPEEPWRPGRHAVEVETILEDLAGNNLRTVFDAVADAARRDGDQDAILLPFDVEQP